jgi:hypothetical protein
MFVCGPCAQHYDYPNWMRAQSLGACEVCGRSRPCDDIGSAPRVKDAEHPPWAIRWATKPYITAPSDGDGDGFYRVCWQMPGKTPDEIDVDRRGIGLGGREREPGINWSSMGTVSPFTAWAMSEMLQLACQVATVGEHRLVELLENYRAPEHVGRDRPLKQIERGETIRRDLPGTAWHRQITALGEGSPCEWRYPARRDWNQGKVVRNGGGGYWEVEDEDGHRIKGLYAEHVKAAGGDHYEDERN